MVDIVDIATRSRMMASIRAEGTKPEMTVRRFLHGHGFRFRLHRKDLPGRPDIVLPKYNLAVFVHGCFWHRHANCFYASTPRTRKEFWEDKLERNVARDMNNVKFLLSLGWRVLVIWECGLKNLQSELILVLPFIKSDSLFLEWPAFAHRAKPLV
ncbi:very short patch repair endonuclease [Pseudomonas sp. RU47]|uniref:very short patch repair endonuclease n=1 Tax=Pseudomonas sp. RU47 TaxID=2005388 RepID=UPI000FDF5B4E|nr:DNA mismatch endonuclease Vsr [Pseudomonas sp. RU47]AZZ77819.1 very short patch repair endonuclease [Pseudomonas sp. RU47]